MACNACHATGVAGAPKYGDKVAWAARSKAGVDALVASAIKGKGAMPPKGGLATATDADIRAAVEYMRCEPGFRALAGSKSAVQCHYALRREPRANARLELWCEVDFRDQQQRLCGGLALENSLDRREVNLCLAATSYPEQQARRETAGAHNSINGFGLLRVLHRQR